MMNRVYFTADNIISSLGFNTEENFENINNGNIGIFPNEDSALSRTIVWASLIDNTKLNQNFERLLTQDSFTRLEKMFILSIKDVIDKSSIDPQSLRSLLIISTTKGNIDLLDNRNKNIFPEERIYLWSLAKAIGNYFGFINIPLVISSACISGSMAIIHAARMIARGEYDNIIVSGGDLATEFVISGFQSFQAISPEPCKPFDRDRKGLSIGEGCGTIFLTCDNTNTGEFGKIAYLGG
ncbi:MAG: 3-oxoacyl-[acyl-carrier-protein] synthase, partial [Bacteroidota bacterium]|nr:3-oxoacyl-[acyl-carrier-protein] synthase [Bacteroidota bacterium]